MGGSLFNHKQGAEYHISYADDAHLMRGWKLGNLALLSLYYGLDGRSGKMADGRPRFLEGPTKIAANPATPWAALFSIVIAARLSYFWRHLHTRPERMEIGEIRPTLSRD